MINCAAYRTENFSVLFLELCSKQILIINDYQKWVDIKDIKILLFLELTETTTALPNPISYIFFFSCNQAMSLSMTEYLAHRHHASI